MPFGKSAVNRTLEIIYVMNFVHHLVLKNNKKSMKLNILGDKISHLPWGEETVISTQLGPKGEAIVTACWPVRQSYSKLRLRLK